ncbi:MAE_28990/MAE_18760 family HEPN-like nuclease [Rhizobacter sp. P5_C2]
MSVQSLEGLQAALERDLSWRKKELSGLRISAMRSATERNYLFRAGLVLICAHWEGFLKKAVEKYVAHVFAQGLRLRDLAPVFVAQALFSDVRRASEAEFPGNETHVRLAERIQLGLDVVCSHSGWLAKTEGNPSSTLVARLLGSVGVDAEMGLDAAGWSTTKVFIDEQVVADRHKVAHGEGFPVSKEQFLERSGRMLDLLDRLSAEIIRAAERKAYRLS